MIDGFVLCVRLCACWLSFTERTYATHSSINFVLSALLFNIVPTALEITLVTSILATQFGWQHAGYGFYDRMHTPRFPLVTRAGSLRMDGRHACTQRYTSRRLVPTQHVAARRR